jgi:hypothetical protein
MRPALALALLLSACGPASVSGNVAGNSFDDDNVVGRLSQVAGLRQVDVVIGGKGSEDLCRDLTRGDLRQGSTYLTITLSRRGDPLPGDYPVGGIPFLDERVANAFASRLDSACGDVLRKAATGGTVTLTEAGADLRGTFDLLFGEDRLTGSFRAPLCSATSLTLDRCL